MNNDSVADQAALPPSPLLFLKLTDRGSYMSAHVLLNLLNELRKRYKMRGLPSVLALFRNEFNKFNNTGGTNVRFYLSYDTKIILKSYYGLKTLRFFYMCDVKSVSS